MLLIWPCFWLQRFGMVLSFDSPPLNKAWTIPNRESKPLFRCLALAELWQGQKLWLLTKIIKTEPPNMWDCKHLDDLQQFAKLETMHQQHAYCKSWVSSSKRASRGSWAKKVSKCCPRSAGWRLSPKQEAPTSKVWLHTKLTMLYSRCLESAAPWAFKTTRQSKPTTDCPLKTGRRITKTKWLALNESCQWDIPHKSS